MAALNAKLARRLAEAADGLRDGLFHYFVVPADGKGELPNELNFSSADSDEEALKKAKEIAGQVSDKQGKPEIFGPYFTEKEERKLPYYSKIRITLLHEDKELEVLESEVNFVTYTDCIALSLSAFEKFFLPYITTVHGAGAAMRAYQNARNIFQGPAGAPGAMMFMSLSSRVVDHINVTTFPRVLD